MRRYVLPIAKLDLKWLVNDPVTMVILLVMPLLVAAFLKPVFNLTLASEGVSGANGAEQAIPGAAVMFSFFLVAFTGYAFFKEHGWNTWVRLRTSGASPWHVLAGKGLPILIVALAQQAILFVAGVILFDLRIDGSLALLFLVALSLSLCLVALGELVAVLTRSVEQAGAIGNLSSILFGGLGGAIAPVALLPRWAEVAGWFTPAHWAIRGYRSVIIGSISSSEAFTACAILLAAAGVLIGITVMKFDLAANKTGWA